MKKYKSVAFISIIICFLAIFIGTNKNHHQNALVLLLKEVVGKKLSFDTCKRQLICGDSIDWEKNNDFRIIHYIDSIGCTRCKLHLDSWMFFMDTLDKIPHGKKVKLIFVTDIENKNLIKSIFKNHGDFPVYSIEHNSNSILDKMIKNKKLNTLLLNSNNIIITVGNPILNENIKKRYYEFITR